MILVSRLALGVALSLGAASLIASAPALAQRAASSRQQQPQREAPSGQKRLELSSKERAAIAPLQKAVEAKDWAAASAALPAAQAGAQGGDAKYAVGSLLLQIGLGTSNTQMQADAIDLMIASGGVPAASLPEFYRNQGALAMNAGNMQKAEAGFAKAIELVPNDANSTLALAEIKQDLKKSNEAIPLFERAIALKKAEGAVPEAWYKRGLKIAYDGKMAPQTIKFSRDLVTAYPTATNWRDALLIYREMARLDQATNLDLMRLMRASKSLNGERDVLELADQLDKSGLPGETKAVIEEAVAARMVDPNKDNFKFLLTSSSEKIKADQAALTGLATKAMTEATGRGALAAADAYYGYGDYAKAISLYRTALQKGSVDTNLVNTRLGMALALSGQRAEADAAFKAVTGPRAELASFWSVWLSQRA